MALVREIRVRARQVAPLVLAICTLAYLAYHAVQGDRGLLAWVILKQELTQAEATLERLTGERERLARRVALLRPDGLDPDMLEERARVLLDYGRPDERVILYERRLAATAAGDD